MKKFFIVTGLYVRSVYIEKTIENLSKLVYRSLSLLKRPVVSVAGAERSFCSAV